jgi:hypothetical protein
MANANTRANFNISANTQYASGTSSANAPSSLGPRTSPLSVTLAATFAGVSTKSFSQSAPTSIIIPASSAYTLDLASFVDNLLAGASWTNLQFIMIEHNVASTASSIDFTGADANAIPSLRGSSLAPGEGMVPYYARSTGGVGTVGKTITGPNSRIVIHNLDAANPATVDILLMGN